jgi:penicillin-binding protein 1A
MRGVVDEGTGTAIRSRFGIQADVAGKTGTTQDNSDGWFILMHRQLVGGAWVGFNDPAVKMGDWGEGAKSALPIVGEVFQQALRNRWIDPKAEFDIPRPKREPKRERERDDPVGDFFSRLFAPLFRRSH